MKGKINIFTKIGLLILVLYFLMDRLIVRIPNIIAKPTLILVLALIIIGGIKRQKQSRKNETDKR
jgi:hypothetical protein